MSDTTNNSTFVQIREEKIGDGAQIQAGQKAVVHYSGYLQANYPNGPKFDSSVDRNLPFSFVLGNGKTVREVILGWDQGILGLDENGTGPMKVGGKRVLTIPAELGYGQRGAGGVIPPNAVLIFEVELLGIETK